MPERLKNSIKGGLKGNAKQFKGRTAEESAYAIMNSIGAMKGSNTTEKGRRMERKLAGGRSSPRGRSDRGEVLGTG